MTPDLCPRSEKGERLLLLFMDLKVSKEREHNELCISRAVCIVFFCIVAAFQPPVTAVASEGVLLVFLPTVSRIPRDLKNCYRPKKQEICLKSKASSSWFAGKVPINATKL